MEETAEQKSPPMAGNVSNTQVAERIGMTHTGVSRIRNGGRFPSARVMNKIAQEFDWSVHDQFQFLVRGDRAGYAAIFRVRVMGEPE